MDQAEQLRILKAGSQQPKALARVITVTSGKGGVGKSNTSINLAIQFKKMGKRVIILDADFGLANIEIMFGTVPKHNLCDLIYQGKSITDIITWGPMGVGFISGGSGIAGMSNLSRDYLNYIIQNLVQLDSIADIIIVDTGAGISDAVLEFLVASSEILLVTTPEPTSITDSYSLVKALYRHPRFDPNAIKVKLVANRVQKEAEGKVLFNKLNAVIERYLKVPLIYLGSVPEDSQLAKSVMQQVPVSLHDPGARSTAAYERVARRLLDKEEAERQPKRGMAAFFSYIINGKR
ncbi:MAG: MinD/ParA family protein [Lachnospiraceae bacterium]|jgi:flagellar biosynthesis protein FlhG|uniref:MinD/ParA family protein n=1 Tax=uncultured Acetatifactor sp. TaxID=1671927 RepID=UPI002614CFEA|nr:MinD/ParA family protein [uncultured Acetatifactor sp.]MCI8789235.1 MinD/ParA family protein [Lachnospiraceae bacterium]